MSKQPRALEYYWEYPHSEYARETWRAFITEWIGAHGESSELADLHWTAYVGQFVEYDSFAALSGAKLTRKAEAAAQRLLANLLASGARCKFCDKMTA